MALPNERTYIANEKRGPYEGPHYVSDNNMFFDYSRDSNQYTLYRLTEEYYNISKDTEYGKRIGERLVQDIKRTADALREEIKNGYQDNPDIPSSASSLRNANNIIRYYQARVSSMDSEGM